MTKEQYARITEATRRVVSHLPGREKCLRFPTYLCAAVYLVTLGWLVVQKDLRVFRAALVPAASFLIVTILRKIINRQRPYDRFQLPPVGKWEHGKGKSLPSRHTVSAVAIAIAVGYVFPHPAVWVAVGLLGALIAALRVFAGQHYPSDVAAAIALAVLLSWIGYSI